MSNSDNDDPPDLIDHKLVEVEAGPSSSPDRKKVPTTLLTGFLGAGKSTLLEYILTADHGYKIAVCMNDFGDTADIEAKALTLTDPLTGEQTTSYLSLPNGCLCCSVKDMGIAAIEELANSQGVDWVMVELTGVADPGSIAKSFWENEEMGDLVLDGVVCVVDSRNVLKQLQERDTEEAINECERQIACADVILLNKTDLVTQEILEEVEQVIRSFNPTLRIHKTLRSQVALSEIFDLKAYTSHPTTSSTIISPSNHEQDQTQLHDLNHNHDHEHHTHNHNHNHNHQVSSPNASIHPTISTILIPLPPLSSNQFNKLNTFLENLIWEGTIPSIPLNSQQSMSKKSPKPEILRTKGLIYTTSGEIYILQGVTDLFELKILASSLDSAKSGFYQGNEVKEVGKVVFIGRNLDGISLALREYIGLEAA